MEKLKKMELEKLYQEFIGSRNVKLPKSLNLTEIGNKIIINYKVKDVINNMQTDVVCFEAWSLLFKLLKNCEIQVDWEEPTFEKGAKDGHYQRFLYRVLKFTEQFPWFTISSENEKRVQVQKFLSEGKILINHVSEDRIIPNSTKLEEKLIKEYSEGDLENLLVYNDNISKNLMKALNLSKVTSQMPVGIFKETISKVGRVFTGGKSAIDIIGINNNNEASVIELKRGGGKNKKFGIISELFFYSNIILDLQHNRVMFDQETEGLYTDLKATKGVNGVLLAPEFHPCVTNPEFIKLFNKDSLVKFSVVKIEGENPEFKTVL